MYCPKGALSIKFIVIQVVGGPHGDKDKMVAAASNSNIILWSIQDGGSGNEIGRCVCLCVL